MEIQRRFFIGAVGASALASTVDAQAAKGKSLKASTQSKWDMSWTERVNRKHRAVFDATEFSDGDSLYRAFFWQRAQMAVYGTPVEDMSGVLLLRGSAIWLAMNDEFWKIYKVGERNKLVDEESGKPYERNPLMTAPVDASTDEAGIDIPSFLATGNIILVCNRTFAKPISLVQKVDKIGDDDAVQKARSFLVPGLILQPSGSFAVIRAQEAGCHYMLD